MRRAFFVTFLVVLGTIAYAQAPVEPTPAEPAPVQPQPPQPVESLPQVPQPPQPVVQPYAPNPYAPTPYAPSAAPGAPSEPTCPPAQPQPTPYGPPAYPPAYSTPVVSPPAFTAAAYPTAIYAPAVSPAPQASNAEQLARKLNELSNLQQEVDRLRQSTGTPSQVLVKLRMVEISLTRLRNLNVENDQLDSALVDRLCAPQAGASTVIEDARVFDQLLAELLKVGVARDLAAPNLVAYAGRPASFHTGGEFPLQSKPANDRNSIHYKKFGTEVDCVPVALGNHRVRLELRFRCSQLDDARGITVDDQRVPSLRVSEVNTGAEMKFGQTMILHGANDTRRQSEERMGKAGQVRVVESIEKLLTLVLVTPEAIDGSAKTEACVAPNENSVAGPSSPADVSVDAPFVTSARRVRQLVPFGPVARVARALPAADPASQHNAKPSPQVYVELRVIDVNLTKLRAVGFAFKAADGSDPFSDFLVGRSGTVPDAAAGFLEALVRENVASEVARPRLIAFSGRLAQLRVGVDVDVAVACQPGKVAKEFVGTEFSVLPRVDPQGTITLDYKVRMNELDRAAAVTIDDHPYHTVKRCEAESAVTLNDGQTAVAGGLVCRVRTTARAESNDPENAAADKNLDEVQRYLLVTARIVGAANRKDLRPAAAPAPAMAEPPGTTPPREAKVYPSPVAAPK